MNSDLDRTLDSLVESFYDGVIFIENDQVVRVNSSFSRITGLKEESILGQRIDDLDGETHICLHTIQEVARLVKRLNRSVTSMGKLMQGNEIYVTATPVSLKGPLKYIIVNVRDITELQFLKEEVSRLMALYLSTPEEARISQLAGDEIIAENRIMRGILDMVARVAQVDSVVLFEGESGTGKEVLARLIHRLGARRKGPFIPVNCGAIPETLFESELFGYVRGAFTGAAKDGKPGLFELANGGIIFLDEIGEMPLNCQVKLLKVIEDQEVMRIGDVKPTTLNARILAASNRDLPEMVKQGKFREDLFYRLYVVPILVPPLRERREDIFPLAWHFLRHYNGRFNQSKTFSREIIQIMESYEWPGNVRELQNIVERMVIMSDKEILEPEHLPPSIYSTGADNGSMIQVNGVMPLAWARETVEKKLLSNALALRGTTREAARVLGVDHSTVVRKLRKYGIRPGNRQS
ncbi:MAG: sigma 54-interacting transcriptional regulator [Deltaproteobacteria bacterium]|nr:sigma 54-interacting transcriptional regulator [Deltaproteobacteria bacterium]MBW2049669.1 sigma 54-interacting transcriptional regulator [Deltaproteobacteria bacterium]